MAAVSLPTNAVGMIRLFLAEQCEIGQSLTVERPLLFEAFASFCKHHGADHGTPEAFRLHLGMFANVQDGPDGWSGRRFYRGISLRTAPERSSFKDQVSAFVRECCAIGEDHETPASDLYAAFAGWCADHSQEPTPQPQFFVALHAEVPALKTIRPRSNDGTRPRIIRGVSISNLGVKFDEAS